MEARQISLNPSTVAWRLGFIAALLVAINLAMQLYRLATHHAQVPGLALMTLDGEHNIPALFSTGLLIGASLLLTLVAYLARAQRSGDASKWLILAAGFAFMGLDESMSFHERLIEPVRHMMGGQHLGLFFFAWVVPAIVLCLALGLYFLPFLLRLPRSSAIAFVVAAVVYLGGAVGVELVEGWWREGHEYRNLGYHALVCLEEGMEMAGVILFIRALLAHIARVHGSLLIEFDGAQAPVSAGDATRKPVGLHPVGR